MGKSKLNPFFQHSHLPLSMNAFNRRMFLRGLGLTLALPFLPSLVPEAYALTDSDYRKAMFMIWSHGVWWGNWAPTGVQMTSVGTNVMAGSLANATLGSYLPADFANLRTKISILEGLDNPEVVTHEHNSSLAGGGTTSGNDSTDPRVPNSIDVIMSKSMKVYGTPAPIPVLRADPYGLVYSHSYENGNNIIMDATSSSKMFNTVKAGISKSPSSGGSPQTPTLSDAQKKLGRKKLMVDQAYAGIQALLNSSKISATDRTIASDYFDMVRDVQTNVNAQIANQGAPAQPVVTTYNCATPTSRTDTGGMDAAKNMADIIVLAMACGVTKLGYMLMNSEHDLVHTVDDPTNRAAHAKYIQTQSLPVASYMMAKMDSITEANGRTMLDNSITLVTSDIAASKYDNHNGMNFPVLVGGSLAGKFRTGQYVSYYNKSANITPDYYTGPAIYGGRPYNELLISIMRGFGLAQADYLQKGMTSGYGVYDCVSTVASCTTNQVGKLTNYYAKTFIPGYANRDVTLPYFYLG